MYGGGFSTVPAYLADIFGTQFVGAIHGRLLTAWSTAGILGPVVVNYMREYQLGMGIPREQVYNQTMYILVGFLALGLICNLLVRPLPEKYFMSQAELEEEKRLAHEKSMAAESGVAGDDERQQHGVSDPGHHAAAHVQRLDPGLPGRRAADREPDARHEVLSELPATTTEGRPQRCGRPFPMCFFGRRLTRRAGSPICARLSSKGGHELHRPAGMGAPPGHVAGFP